MELHLLLTSDVIQTKPDSCKIKYNFGKLQVKFEDETTRTGLHCIVEDTEENIISWLKHYDGFVKGSGIPQLEQFSIVHIKY